jgi:alanine dehydrogenase
MDIVIPIAHRPDELRVALTPVGVRVLTSAGHRVYVACGAGTSAGFDDAAFIGAGAQITYSADEIYTRGDLLVTIDGVPDTMLGMLRPRQIVCGFLHLTLLSQRARAALADSGIRTVSYELIQRPSGVMPVLLPMSEIAGRLLPQLAARLLETPSGGRGTLLAPIPGVPSADVVILGAGTVGVNAASGFAAAGVQTTVLDHDIDKLRYCEQVCRGQITTRLTTESAIAQVVQFADVLIGAVHVPGDRAPLLVSRPHVTMMKPRSVIIDIAIDQGGCIATSRPTTHRDPTYVAEGVIHYAVPNIPSAVVRTSAHALNNALLPYIQAIADLGLDRAAASDPALARGVGPRLEQPSQLVAGPQRVALDPASE